jgi:hypothetical protein
MPMRYGNENRAVSGLAGGGVAGWCGGFEQRRGGGENAVGPEAALAWFEPENWGAEIIERRGGEEFVEQIVNALLEGAIFGAKTVGRDFEGDRRHADEQRIGIHPPREPQFEMRLAAEFVDEVAVVVEDGAIADDVRGAAGGIEFRGDLGVKNPELAFERGGGIDGEWRLAGDFGDEFDVVRGFFQKRADFVGESGLADAVSADEREFHFLCGARELPSSNTDCRL